MKKHIQASGAKQGQWVACNATGVCRNGGTHITDKTFNDAHDWLAKNDKKKPKYQITEKDISDYKKAVIEGYKSSHEMNSEEKNKAFETEVTSLRQAALEVEAKQIPKTPASRFVDYRDIEKSLARGESPQGEGQFQIGLIMRRGFRKILDENDIKYRETKLGGASEFDIYFSGSRQAKVFAHLARRVHWMESEDTARKYEEFRTKLRSENRKKLFNRSARVPIPLSGWSEEEIANGLFDGTIVRRKNANGSMFLAEA